MAKLAAFVMKNWFWVLGIIVAFIVGFLISFDRQNLRQDLTSAEIKLSSVNAELATAQAELVRAREDITLVRAECSWRMGIEARMADKMALLAYLISIKYPIENDPVFLLEHPELIQINSEERSIAWPTRNGSRKLGGLDWFPSAPR